MAKREKLKSKESSEAYQRVISSVARKARKKASKKKEAQHRNISANEKENESMAAYL